MSVDLLTLAVAGAVGAAAAVTAALAPAARRIYLMTPSPAPACTAPIEVLDSLTDCESTDFYPCPAEQERRMAHAVSPDGSRRCWSCGHTTPSPGEAS